MNIHVWGDACLDLEPWKQPLLVSGSPSFFFSWLNHDESAPSPCDSSSPRRPLPLGGPFPAFMYTVYTANNDYPGLPCLCFPILGHLRCCGVAKPETPSGVATELSPFDCLILDKSIQSQLFLYLPAILYPLTPAFCLSFPYWYLLP
ncbi:hypothetical protein L211DRAFT_215153 [Terfezia boudieri ATCC MYA-4762]|uniref:Uncharacterized protein n=1 Tax=Terfezia boudieri ATCC MYA-4762 TaxID=1051890 RepID=A0A3N4LMZ9_9PEZI|nr:hypothetical protein L211DRAFT_215153 [Terfezia boudieri ATCC MYA-4762]